MGKPRIFIGSSVKGKFIADALLVNLEHDAHVFLWPSAFVLSDNNLDRLIERFAECDYAVFVFSADDKIEMGVSTHVVARDNVIFEAGLFMGTKGKQKCFIVTPRDLAEYHLPTDLYGFIPATYDSSFLEKSPVDALAYAASLIRTAVAAQRGQLPQIRVNGRVSFAQIAGVTYPLKLHIDMTNETGGLIVVSNLTFSSSKSLIMDERFEEVIDAITSKPKISLIYPGQEIRYSQVVIEAGKGAMAWIPFLVENEVELRATVGQQTAGIFGFKIHTLSNGKTFEMEVKI